MPDNDPLAALSAAAKNRAAAPRVAITRPGAKPMADGSGAVRRPGPRKPQKSPLIPILGGVALLVVIVVVVVTLIVKFSGQSAPPPVDEAAKAKAKPVEHPPGELFTNVPAQAPGDAAPASNGGQ